MAGTTRRRCLYGIAVLAVAALAWTTAALAGGGPSLPTKAKVAGMKQEQWVEAWWQWAYDYSGTNHPVAIDTVGNYAAAGQHGPVWFLGGIFGNNSGIPVTRTFSMPAGYYLFFPLMNSTWDNGGVAQVDWISEDAMIAGVRAWVDGVDVDSLSCTVDGTALTGLDKQRITGKKPFSYTCPSGNIYQSVFAVDFEGPVFPSWHDGYWIMLKPLAAGPHTIHFTAKHRDANSIVDFDIDVTYNITVTATPMVAAD